MEWSDAASNGLKALHTGELVHHFDNRSEINKNNEPPTVSCNVLNTSQTRTIFDSISYGKGAAVIKQLVFVIGLESFKEGLKEYLIKYSFGNTDFYDLIGILCKKCPELKSWAEV